MTKKVLISINDENNYIFDVMYCQRHHMLRQTVKKKKYGGTGSGQESQVYGHPL